MDEQIKSNIESLELYSDNYPFSLSLRIRNFENESTYKGFIKNTEMLIRRCNEYRLWRNYIIDVLGINECMVTKESISEVTIDLHHHIPGLFVFVTGLVNEKIETGKDFCSFDIACEAMELHFQNKVGYTTLIKSMHEKFHNGYLTIPINYVKGDYQYFLKKYSKYLDEVDLEVIDSRLAINESNCTWSVDNYPVASGGAKI